MKGFLKDLGGAVLLTVATSVLFLYAFLRPLLSDSLVLTVLVGAVALGLFLRWVGSR